VTRRKMAETEDEFDVLTDGRIDSKKTGGTGRGKVRVRRETKRRKQLM